MSIHSSSSDPDPKLSRVRLHQIKPYLRSLYSTTVCYDDFILNLADLWCTFYLLALFNYVLSSQFNNVKKKSISSAINGNSRYVFLASCIMRHLYIGFQWLTSHSFLLTINSVLCCICSKLCGIEDSNEPFIELLYPRNILLDSFPELTHLVFNNVGVLGLSDV